MKPNPRLTAGAAALVIFSVFLTGCGGSSTTAEISVSGDNVVVINNRIGVTDDTATLNVKATALADNKLFSLVVKSADMAGLNEQTLNLNTTQFSTTLDFAPVENKKVSIGAGTINTADKKNTNTKSYTVHNVVRYMSNDDRQVLSIHRPMQPKAGNPAILFIHGNWLDFSYFYDNAIDAAKEGYVAITMDFRSFDTGTSQMPDQIEDVRCAIQYMKANSTELNIDPDNIGIVGYSVGAMFGLLTAFGSTNHIANGAGYSSRCPYSAENTNIKAIAALSVPNDVLQLLATISDSTTPLQTRHAFENLIGVPLDASKPIRDHYNAYMKANPGATLAQWRAAIKSLYNASTSIGNIVSWAEKLSPNAVLANRSIPLYFMHGKTDLTFPCAQSIQNVSAATQSDVYFYVFTASGNDHNWQNYTMEPKTEARMRYTAFFNKYLAGEIVDIPTETVTCDI